MDQEALKQLAITQITALQQLAESEGHSSLANQFKLMLVALDATDTIQSAENTANRLREERAGRGVSAVIPDYDDSRVNREFEDFDYVPFEDIEELDDEPQPPAGFENEEEYQSFLEQQGEHATVADPETGEQTNATQTRPDDVAGVVPDAVNGGYKEVGDLDESIDSFRDIQEEANTIRDEETGEVIYRHETAPVDSVDIKFARLNGENLTQEDLVNKVFAHPQAQPMLSVFGDDYSISENGLGKNELVANFIINQRDDRSRKTAELVKDARFAAFGGQIIVPGLGAVLATPILD